MSARDLVTVVTIESYQEHLDSLGIDPSTIVVDDNGTVAIDPGALSPATLSELPVLAIDDASDTPGNPPELRLEDQLGEGGMGVVFSATQIPLRRRVAVKVLRNEVAGAIEKGQLLREALVTGSLEHPNIVPVHALGRAPDGRPMLVMKQIEGTPWRQSLQPLFVDDQPPPAERVEEQLQILVQVCRAVEFAHSRGIIHRDIKPGNVMIGSFGEVYLLDWGLAVSLRSDTGLPHVSQVGGLAGTPAYMAPEMAAGDEPIDERADVYLLGAVLHELCTGTKRHRGGSVVDTLAAAHASVPVAYGEQVPVDLAAICNRATAHRPDERYPDVASLREALVAFIHHRGSRRLADEARLRLHAYEDLLDQDPIKSTLRDPDTHNLATEARFGFQLALREWPDNPEAREGLQRLLERMIEFELERENRAAVAALLTELPDPRPDLERRFDALGRVLRQRKAEYRELERMRADADLSVLARERQRVTYGLGIALAVLVSVLFGLRMLGLRYPGYPDALGVVISFGLLTLVGRRRLQRAGANLANLRLMDSLVVTALCLGTLFASGMIGGVPFSATVSASMILAAVTCSIVAVTIEWRLLPSTLGFALAGILVAVAPEYRGLFVALGSLASFGYAGWVWHRWIEGGGEG